jgi:hypothetical protein
MRRSYRVQPPRFSQHVNIARVETRSAKDHGMAKLTPLHREVLDTLPQGDRQEGRVLHAVLQPGESLPAIYTAFR